MGVRARPTGNPGVPNAAFDAPCTTTLYRLDDVGTKVNGQRLAAGRAVLSCRVVAPDLDHATSA